MSRKTSRRSWLGLNLANFFLGEVLAVVLAFLNDFLQDKGWSYESIGLATSIAGVGALVAQTPAGFVVDWSERRRGLFAGGALSVGILIGLLPFVPAKPAILYPLLFAFGAAEAFFGPLLGALALGLAGHERMNRTFGTNQGFSHAGNIAAALLALVLVRFVGVASVFVAVALISIAAALSMKLIDPDELEDEQKPRSGGQAPSVEKVRKLLRDRRVVVLLGATALLQLANAPIVPMVALDLKRLGGSDSLVAASVLVGQAVMVPAALLAGWLGDRWGHKRVYAVAFVAIPLRALASAATDDPRLLVAAQALGGIGVGVYGVVIVALAADLTRGRGHFNALVGMTQTAQALGACVGPLASGFLIDRIGFDPAYVVFAVAGIAGAIVFLGFMPGREEKPGRERAGPGKLRPAGA